MKHFTKEIAYPSSKKSNNLPSTPYINQFKLFLDKDQLLCCHGRIGNSSEPESSKTPFLLPSKDKFTELVISETHEFIKHNGIRDTLSTIRSKFWILRGREAVKRFLRHCVICRRHQTKPFSGPPTPELPESRVDDSPPFTNTGLDFAGPLYVRPENNIDTTKVWMLLFTCASTRAIHLELSPGMDAQLFLRCFRRFVSRKGLPSKLISDNAKTFRSSVTDIRRITHSDEVLQFLADKQITWDFIVEKAPWWGGFWERLVKSVKLPLRKVIGKASLSYDELQTILTEIETIVNSRPITYVYDDEESLSYALTPCHLIYGRRIATLPNNRHYEIINTHESLLRRERHQKRLLRQFTTQWRKEYLLNLRENTNIQAKNAKQEAVLQGEIVLLKDDNKKRAFWKLAKVEELIKGKDGHCRAAYVKVSNDRGKSTILRRPIQHLIPLEVKGR